MKDLAAKKQVAVCLPKLDRAKPIDSTNAQCNKLTRQKQNRNGRTRIMDHQPIDSIKLARLLFERVVAGEPPLRGYDVAGALIGRNPKTSSRHMGQVTSRIDAACFEARLPMLATHMVRKPDGSFNPDMFQDEWAEFRDEIQSVAENHKWTEEERNSVMKALAALPDNSSKIIWAHYAERGRLFIRHNLHRNVIVQARKDLHAQSSGGQPDK